MYSLRDSIIKPDDLVARLKEIGQNTVAITDHGGSLGGVTLYQALSKADIRYIHGVEFYICDDTSVKDKDNKYYHLIALCKNETGRINMNHLITMSEHPDRKYMKPRIDYGLLSKYGDGLIITSACIAGEVSRRLMYGDHDSAVRVVDRYRARFGEDYYLEIQSHREPEQIALNKQIIELAQELDVPYIVTTDAHYAWESDREFQNKYAFNGAYKEDGESYVDCFLQSEEEVRQRLTYLPQGVVDTAISNTHIIAEKCQMEIPLSAPIMPHIDTPEQYPDNRSWLTALCAQGFQRKLNIDMERKCLFDESKTEYRLTQEQIDEYISRYEYELDALYRMGFLDYILLVYTYANVGERRGIARGSGGGSLINYLTDITNIDPIEHGLYFERFIDVGALARLEAGEITAKELKIPD